MSLYRTRGVVGPLHWNYLVCRIYEHLEEASPIPSNILRGIREFLNSALRGARGDRRRGNMLVDLNNFMLVSAAGRAAGLWDENTSRRSLITELRSYIALIDTWPEMHGEEAQREATRRRLVAMCKQIAAWGDTQRYATAMGDHRSGGEWVTTFANRY